MPAIEILDVADEACFGLIPPCADQSFDHRSCDYWEDADRGSKASRPSWLGAGSTGSNVSTGSTGSTVSAAGSTAVSTAGPAANPFAPTPKAEPNPFLPSSSAVGNPLAAVFTAPPQNPFLEDRAGSMDDNPFAPRRPTRPTVAAEAPRKLQLLGRGLAVFGTYAKLLLVDGEAAGYCQFGPLSAYPRALRTRQLYPKLPDAPLPAVITCIATTADARRSGLALRLVQEVCDDLAGRGFAAVEAYPEVVAREDATPAARPEFWIRAGFTLAVADDRYPVVRREL